MTDDAATILIVDDEQQNRRLLEALLIPEGYVTLCAASGEEALRSIAATPPDLILLDVMMPMMDGYAVASILKADPKTSNIPIIMVSAQIDHGARLAGLEAGAEEFLTKPVDRAELWLRVRNLLRLKAYGDLLQNHRSILEQQVLERTADLQRFRTAMDFTADAIFLVSRATMRILEVNATASSMLGYTRSEFLGMGPADFSAGTGPQLASIFDAVHASDRAPQLREMRVRRKDGSDLPVESRRHAQRIGDDWVTVTVLRDTSEREESEMRLQRQSHYDLLTGLPNRTLFYETLDKALATAKDQGGDVAVLSINLDRFKNVNDTFGHDNGNALLVQVSSRLLQCVLVRDIVGHLGGDEFALVLAVKDAEDGPAEVAASIRQCLRAPFVVGDNEVTITASIGISIYPIDAIDSESLIRFADTAMYRAKREGRDTLRFFTADMNAEVLNRIETETALRKALENDEFVLHYQPKVESNTSRIIGVEALLRWQRPGRATVSPAEFIPILEETGLILDVGRWVVATACTQIAAWARSEVGLLPVSVNVSARQLSESDLLDDVVQAIEGNGISAHLLELELTESSLMANTERTNAALHGLREIGVKISIDDFGTGYSSLAYLSRLPVDKLKIDIALVREITTNEDDAVIARAIIQMAHSLKLEVIAEGVETTDQLTYLRRNGCDQIQGYHFSPPLPVKELEALVQANREHAFA